LSKIGGGEGSDQTLEMLMTHLSEKSRALFYPPPAAEGSGKNGSALGVDMSWVALSSLLLFPPVNSMLTLTGMTLSCPWPCRSTACLLSTLFPTSQTTLDSYAFNPCGYSANALVLSPNPTPSTITPPNPSSSSSSSSSSAAIASSPPSLSEGYWTVHVTPEASHSYASFETNISLPSTSLSSPPHHHHHSSSSTPAYDNPFPDLKTLMRNVVAIFEPGRLTVTLFVSHEEQGHEGEDGWGSGAKVLDDRLVLDGYKRRDRIGYEFEGYDLVFCCFEKIGWVEARD
jgi:S-adenosylmethionine decarboxylase